MWEKLFRNMLAKLIRQGELHVTFPDGQTSTFGPGAGIATCRETHDASVLRGLCTRPDLTLGEAYMDGRITIENDDIDALIRLVLRNRHDLRLPAQIRLMRSIRLAFARVLQQTSPSRARRNVAHHYDISNDLYRLFLDQDMQYSCAYFNAPDMTLEDAQEAKKTIIARKLQIEPGMRVLDIGCGWGGMALTLARDYGAHVTGVTLSQEQLTLAKQRASSEGLDDQIDFRLCDYRDLNDTFDRIVSVGMLEHVGLPHYGTYFDTVFELLDPDGVALIHTIGRTGPPMAQSEWINRYIFPGGYVPSLSELAPAVENSGLWTLDIEIWRLHYAKTLRLWLSRFDANLDHIQTSYDARFVRMFRYYLTVCYLAFEEQYQAVFQFQLAHQRDVVPSTRDYLYAKKQDARAATE